MLNGCSDYRDYLRLILSERIAQNASFSLRQYAKDLGLHHTSLVQLFKKKRNLSVERGHDIAKKLNLEANEIEYFCASIQLASAKSMARKSGLMDKLASLSPQSDQIILSVDQFKIISEWYHLPILQMFNGEFRDPEKKLIAKSLQISIFEVELALERLTRLGLVSQNLKGEFKKTEARLLIDAKVKTEALIKFHTQMLAKAAKSLSSDSASSRVVGSETFAFDRALLPAMTKLINQFLNDAEKLAAKSKSKDSIYHLSTCLFNLTPEGNFKNET